MSRSQESPIIANDDDGKPITEQDLVTESYQKPLQNSPANLMPSFDFEGTEEDWEQQQLIEAVRPRRRAAKT
jgi:hypothetical protein